jgi:hypothetical protein
MSNVEDRLRADQDEMTFPMNFIRSLSTGQAERSPPERAEPTPEKARSGARPMLAAH